MVGQSIASKLAARGAQVTMGSRSDGGAAAQWAKTTGGAASAATFKNAAEAAELIFNCTNGETSLEALRLAGAPAIAGKILIDVANPLSHQNPGTLTICNTDSLGEQIQREFPDARVVKTLNTVNCEVMVDPGRIPGDHCVFVAGNEADAKGVVTRGLATWFGWPASRVIDLGGIQSARGTEMYLQLWLSLWRTVGHADYNLQVHRR